MLQEQARNTLSKPRLIRHDPSAQGRISSPIPGVLPELAPSLSSCKTWKDPTFKQGMKVFVTTDEEAQANRSAGFPIIDNMQCAHETFMAHINIFGNPSRAVSTVLRPDLEEDQIDPDLETLAKDWLGKVAAASHLVISACVTRQLTVLCCCCINYTAAACGTCCATASILTQQCSPGCCDRWALLTGRS